MKRLESVQRVRGGGTARGVLLTVLGLAAAALLVPAVLPDYQLQLTALFLPFSILALSLNLLWGENKLISFGHGAFFAAGGYVGALILLGRPGDVVGGAASFLEEATSSTPLESLLSTLQGISIAGMPIPAFILPPLLVGGLGFVIGLVVFRVASPEIYLPLVTLGIGVVAGIWFNQVAELGGSNGLGGVPPFTREIVDSSSPAPAYLFNLIWVVVFYGGYWLFRRSRMGWTWRALGDDPVRLEALGYPVRLIRACGFGVSTAIAAFAGVLYAATSGFVGPSLAGVAFSAQALIWVAVGGVGTILGPLIGTLLVKWGEQILSSDLGLENSWQLFLGLLLILVVLVAPGGIMGISRDGLRGSFRRGGAKGEAPGVGSLEATPSVGGGEELSSTTVGRGSAS
jgi:urea transport system permease protein